jgi:hypothetical protein
LALALLTVHCEGTFNPYSGFVYWVVVTAPTADLVVETPPETAPELVVVAFVPQEQEAVITSRAAINTIIKP